MLEAVVGRSYGPVELEVSRAKVAEYVAATGDDTERWIDHAPPAYAGAILFRVAPLFLDDPDVAPSARMVIHGEQVFEWHRPLTIGSTLQVTGSLDRVRERGGIGFATFLLEATDSDGVVVLGARSTFLLSGDVPPGGDAEERVEPAPDDRAQNDPAPPAGDGLVATLAKSASRTDLVRYAAASGDFNPIHWDHSLAADAGLGGVVAHGLLVAAWATQPAAAVDESPCPLQSARFRFRLPVHPAAALTISSSGDGSNVATKVESEAGEHIAATITTRGA